ncbi:MAG TPA: ABATE domain-containing protein [Candidatus Sulfotelmatobacter sp.]|nr:ABATE domain-containing protein [Candidatus Sulfotelmatobacter sp.]
MIAGSLCLDFINTLDDRYSGEPKELLKSYIDLARFGEDARILSDEQVDRLFTLSQTNPAAAERVRQSAIRMREAMHEVFWAIVQRKPVPKAAVMVLNGYIQEAARHLDLVPGKGHFEWRFDPSPSNFDAPLWPIARSAAELLASDQLQFVRACASKTCEWLFLDESKNHRRRWCDMTKCGNRAKARSFYTRQKQPAS